MGNSLKFARNIDHGQDAAAKVGSSSAELVLKPLQLGNKASVAFEFGITVIVVTKCTKPVNTPDFFLH